MILLTNKRTLQVGILKIHLNLTEYVFQFLNGNPRIYPDHIYEIQGENVLYTSAIFGDCKENITEFIFLFQVTNKK